MRAVYKTLYFFICFLLWKIWRMFIATPSVVVLMYHSVSDNEEKLTVAPHVFAGQMAYLRKNRNVVPLHDVLRHAKGEIVLPEGSIAVTIDDGYQDTIANAVPVLTAQKIPVTLFLTSDLSRRPELANLPRPTWEELLIAQKSGYLTIGLHGHEHKHLKAIVDDEALLKKELGDSMDLIAKELGSHPTVYAYAFGERDARVIPYLTSIGVKAAFGITDGIIQKGDDAMVLRRVQVDRTIGNMLFRLRTSGAVAVASRIKYFLGR